LVITFTVVVLKELTNCITQRSLTEENQSAKALFLHRSREPLNMSVEIGRSLWQSQTGETIWLKDRSKTAEEFHVSIHQQVSASVEKFDDVEVPLEQHHGRGAPRGPFVASRWLQDGGAALESQTLDTKHAQHRQRADLSWSRGRGPDRITTD
jgi:hypothetical protein